jgi:hypothetical protein
MLDRPVPQFDEVRHGEWSRDQLETMDLSFRAAMERAFECGLESRAAARATVRVGRPRVTEDEAIEAVWIWFCRHTDVEDIAFADVVARVRILLPNVTAVRVRAGFEKRFRANPRVRFGG